MHGKANTILLSNEPPIKIKINKKRSNEITGNDWKTNYAKNEENYRVVAQQQCKLQTSRSDRQCDGREP